MGDAIWAVIVIAAILTVVEVITNVVNEPGLFSANCKRCEAALPIARHQAEAEAALIETKAALRWALRQIPVDMFIERNKDCPPIIKEMLGEGSVVYKANKEEK